MTFVLVDSLCRFRSPRRGTPIGRALRSLLLVVAVGPASMTAEGTVTSFTSAEMSAGSGPAEIVSLPITVGPGRDARTPVTRAFRWTVSLVEPKGDLALYFPVLSARVQLRVNGQVVADTLETPGPTYPRGVDRIFLQQVAQGQWVSGVNTIELVATGPRGITVSAMELGPRAELVDRERRRALAVVVGPFVSAVVVGALGVCMLLLWSRTREPLFGYFGLGATGWAIHSTWSVLPWSLLPPEHYVVWWTWLYVAFVCLLVVFCLRFADWRLPALEGAMWWTTLLSPVVLYLAQLEGQLALAAEALRLGLIGFVAIGVVAVGRAALRVRNMDGWLIATAGVVSLAFAVHDWLLAHFNSHNSPVYLVPYAGLVFVIAVARTLVDRFVRASLELRRLNVDLERLVEQRSAALKTALEQMRAARDAAQSANKSKSRLLAAASHDLRQPAHALGLYMEALRAAPLAPAQAALVQRMAASLDALEHMFGALLDVARMDTGDVAVVPRVFDLSELLRRLADEFAPQAEHKGLRLVLRLPQEAALALSDEVLIGRVVRNLLSNAVKYTSRGGVLVACRCRGATPGAFTGDWRVEVWDSGVGIARADRDRVFEEFVQLHNVSGDRDHGLGLGLAIVRRLVGLLGLTLQFDSRLGHGSRFALQLPRVVSPSAGARAPGVPPAISHAQTPGLGGIGVVVIEDDAEVRRAMREMLTGWGCLVSDAADADSLMSCAAGQEPPHALVVDYRLADGRTGPAEARALFGRWRKQLPVLVVTGEATERLQRELEGAGFACMIKPVLPDRLRHWLLRAVHAQVAGPPQEAA